MATKDEHREHHLREEVHGLVEEEREEFAREELIEAAVGDYTTEIVPQDKRRPTWHLTALMITLYLQFAAVFLGFTFHDGGYSLLGTVAMMSFGTALYMAYAIPAGYLGTRVGQTHSVLSRSIFGSVGSGLISVMLFFIFLGWAGFQANLTAQLLGGLVDWHGILAIGVVLGVLMVTNNTIGFTGISAWARYVVSPLMILWITYLVIKGLVDVSVTGHPKTLTSIGGFGAAVTFVIGLATWGQEPDFFRFGKPKFWIPIVCYIGAFVTFVLCAAGGWMIGQIASSSDFGPALKTITDFSFFGLTWLAFAMVLVGQVAINDGNYYTVINAGQNILAGVKGWNRLYMCAIAAAGVGLAAWLIPYVISNGFYKVAAVTAVAIPTATVIMMLDYFALPRWFGISRSLDQVPRWSQAARVNWPAFIALVIAAGFGGWASGVYPGQDPSNVVGIPPLESWALGAILYLGGVAIVRARHGMSPGLYRALGFSDPALASLRDRGVDPTAPPRGGMESTSEREGVVATSSLERDRGE